jgi:hypothetical protein
MRILINQRVGGAFGYITESWKNALEDAGHVVQRYDGSLDHWRKFDPDLYVGCSGHRQTIPLNRRAKVAIHVNPYGPNIIPGIMEPRDAIVWTLAQRPDVVFGYGHESDRHYWQYWTDKERVRWVPMPTAGDVTLYNDLNRPRDLDIVYVGGRWGYKAKTIDTFLLPALKVGSHQVRGWGDWQQSVGVTPIGDEEVNVFFNRGKVAPCIAEIHTHDFGIDLPERVFKTSLAGCLPIHDGAKEVQRYLPSLISASTPGEFCAKIAYYINNDAARYDLVKRVRQEVLSGHTYHHRMAVLLNSLGFDGSKMLEALVKRL